jgi:hypothetical protein
VVSAIFIGLAILVPFGGVVAHSTYGWWKLQSSQPNLISGRPDLAVADATAAEGSFAAGQSEISNLSWLMNLLRIGDWANNYQHLLAAGQAVATSAKYSSQAAASLQSIGSGLVQTDITARVDPQLESSQISDASSSFKNAQSNLTQAQTFLSQVDRSLLPGLIQAQFDQFKAGSSDWQTILSAASSGSALLPELLGLNGPRTYLVMIMDNQELRPGGGVVNSYGLLRFEDGKLRDLKVSDTSAIDSPVTGTPDKSKSLAAGGVAVPTPLKDYLGVATLTAHDSNWSPDFPTWSKTAQSIFQNETQRSSDGAVAVDLTGLSALLKAIGPITLADFGEQVTSDNLAAKVQIHDLATSGAPQETFITAVTRATLEKTIRNSGSLWPKLFPVLQGLLLEKHLVLASNNQQIEAQLAQSSWDGGVKSVVSSPLAQDYLMVVDANVGGNKANYFVKNSINYLVKLDQSGGATAQVTLNYDHTGKSDSWPDGHYRDFVRVYAPLGSKIVQATVSGSTAPVPVISVDELGKTSFALIFDMPIGSQRAITLTYSLPLHLAPFGSVGYHLYVQKQSGVEAPQFKASFDAPISSQLSLSGGGFQTGPLESQTTLLVDREFNLAVAP